MPGTSQTTTGRTFSRSENYYYEVVVFEVEGTLYRAFKESFTKWSQSVFRDMFSLPQSLDDNATSREGGADENPIRLVGCTKAEFESLLELMNPREGPGVPSLSKEQWVGVLKLGRLWDMPKVASLAIENLDTFNLNPIDQVSLGKAHGVPGWLKSGYLKLIGDLSDDISFEELAVLGFETVSRILWAREKVQSAERATQRAVTLNGIWVDKQLLCCSYCWKVYNIVKTIAEGTTHCGTCTQLHSSTSIVAINRSYTSLTIPEPTACVVDPVPGKVDEIFGEEIKDAERRSTSTGA